MQDPSTYQQIEPQFPEHEQLKCPRCESTNTKFCYYNNYNLSQPRHLCKNCKRYWTKGGTLRNIPVGGGSRKNTKRISSSSKPKCSSSSTVQTVYGSSAAFEQDCLRIDSFGSVLGPNGQFLYPHGSTVQLGEFGETPNSKSEMQSGNNNSDNFLRVESGGDSSCCGGGSGGDVWPDLAIYTPSSTFR